MVRRARAPRANSCAITARVKATKVNMISEGVLSAAGVNAARITAASAATTTGTTSTRRSELQVTLRHASTGPIPESRTSTSAIGVVRRSNQGGPTLAFSPVSASEMSGKKVPQKITRQRPTSTRLFSRKKDSRESSESSLASLRRWGRRLMMSPADTATTRPMKTRNCTPIVESPKAWIESRIPERTRNVPTSASANVAQTRHTFHTFSRPRFSCTMIEWMNAVPVSQGMSEAFSTGSQAQ